MATRARTTRSWRTGVLGVAALALLGACTSGSGDGTGAVASSASSAPSAPATSRATTAAPRAGELAPEGFVPLNRTVGLGLLRVMSLEERPNPRDVVVYQSLPNELPRVAGVITTVGQTPLSHVNLRAVQDKVPNAVIPGALDEPAIASLVGRYVRYTVSATGFTLAAATQAEVEAHHAAARPQAAQTPERDLDTREITPLADVGFEDWRAFGVKAANLATLRRIGLPSSVEVPDGFAVPFGFYDEFMKANGFYDDVEDLLADTTFRDDPEEQDERLAALREAIKDAPMPGWMMEDLERVQRSFPRGTPIRCRSSTNNEDLPDFSGAGLYDSKTQHPDEGHLSKCVKQVYASVWNLRAFLERDFHRIDHLATAMGVLLHPNFDDEAVNGVAVSADPVYDNLDAHYVNAQLGEDLVTNPDARSVPESLLLFDDGETSVLTYSNLTEPGARLLSDEHVAALREVLRTVHTEFARLYEPADGERFAMEIEFKVTKAQRLSVKQARTWVFN